MTAGDLIRSLRERKGTALSVALHVLVLGWGLISFSSRSMEAPPPEDVIPVDISSDDNLSKVTAGMKDGKKENPKPLVEKVAEAKPVDDAVGKITDKAPIVTPTAPEPPPKPEEKPVEKKPDPPKPVVEKPKEAPKKAEKKPDEKGDDPIADTLKADNKKPTPKETKATPPPQPPKPKARPFDQSKIAALLDNRDPTRESITGAALNASASLGTVHGTAAQLSQSELDAMRARLASLWNVQPGVEHPEELKVTVRIRLGPDKRLIAPPQVVSTGSSPMYQAAAEAAVRAVIQGQPYNMLRDQTYDQWKYMDIDFDPQQMFHS
jgi:outer membrane biosynthesis protein TonB